MIKVYAVLLAVAVAAAGTAYYVGSWRGYNSGVEHERAAHEKARLEVQAELFRLGETISRQAADLLALEAEREALVHSLEEAARAAPNAGGDGIGPDGLLRLQQRWGAP